MALFVDGPVCTIEDLTDQDSGLLGIAQTNGINVATKLRLAQEEIGTELQLWLDKPKPSAGMLWGPPALRVGQIVATAPLRRWETMRSLALVYRDAYFSQLVDRYQAKWQEFNKLAGDARESFIAIGMGVVADPLPQARPPLLAGSPAPQSGGTFYASVAWVNAAGQEGAASAASSILITDGNLMTVTAVDPPKNAAGFNIYGGTDPYATTLQNEAALPVGVTYLYVPGHALQGRRPGAGQAPDFIHPMVRTWSRG
jgi:hypothetical protein